MIDIKKCNDKIKSKQKSHKNPNSKGLLNGEPKTLRQNNANDKTAKIWLT